MLRRDLRRVGDESHVARKVRRRAQPVREEARLVTAANLRSAVVAELLTLLAAVVVAALGRRRRMALARRHRVGA